MAYHVSAHPLHDEAAAARWQTLSEASAQRTPYATVAYVRAQMRAFDLETRLYLVTEDGTDVAGVLVCSRRRGPFREVVVPPFTAFTPILLREAPRETDVHAGRTPLTPLLQRLAADYALVRLHLHPALTDLRPVQWAGWDVQTLYTYRQPLAPAEALLRAWSSSTRRTFRKHADAFVVEEPPADQLALIAELAQASYVRQDAALPGSPEQVTTLLRTLHEAGHVRCFAIRPTEAAEPVGGMAVLHDDREAHYWLVGSEPGPAMTVLLGTVLPRLHADGLATWDWVGANTPSIAEFKRRFGPSLTPYARVEHVAPRSLRLLLGLKRALLR